MGSQMKPRHIKLLGPNPLTDCFGKAEAEQAAAVMILAMGSGPWAGVTPLVMADALTAYQKEAPTSLWLRNPAFRPNIDRLVADGFAAWVGDETEGRKRPVRFTAEGLKALRLSRWNSCAVTVCSACYRTQCWQGYLFCNRYKGAGSVEKTPWQLKKLQAEGVAEPEDPSYWDICDQCGTSCGGKCDG